MNHRTNTTMYFYLCDELVNKVKQYQYIFTLFTIIVGRYLYKLIMIMIMRLWLFIILLHSFIIPTWSVNFYTSDWPVDSRSLTSVLLTPHFVLSDSKPFLSNISPHKTKNIIFICGSTQWHYLSYTEQRPAGPGHLKQLDSLIKFPVLFIRRCFSVQCFLCKLSPHLPGDATWDDRL